jgi:pimeloyl-ACP methyl ester carboxylesterase
MARRRSLAVAGPSRVPTGLILRLILIVVILAAVVGVVLSAAGGFFAYRIVTDYNDTENVSPDSFLLSNYESLNFTDSKGEEHAGWLLRGRKGAPVIVLCHGYDSNRSELLSLGTVLQAYHFNVYIFNFRGVKPKSLTSDFGAHQVAILQAALDKVTKQPDINPSRMGLFGKTTGGYAALVVAEQNPMVKSVVVDNAYEKPIQMFNAQVDQVLGSTTVFRVIMDTEFRLLNAGDTPPQLDANFSKLNPIPKFFISGRDVPALAAVTEGFYDRAAQPKRLIVMDHTQYGTMNGNEKQEYENQILAFYQQSLSLRAD